MSRLDEVIADLLAGPGDWVLLDAEDMREVRAWLVELRDWREPWRRSEKPRSA